MNAPLKSSWKLGWTELGRLASWSLLVWLPAFQFVSAQSWAAESNSAHATAINYDRDIRPILAQNCFACHGFDGSARQADLRLDTRQGALTSGSGDAVVPGDVAASQLIQRIDAQEDGLLMPPPESGKTLSPTQRELLRQWIAQGAEYQSHWSFAAPQAPPIPHCFRESEQSGVNCSSVRTPIDSFVQEKLTEVGLSPASTAAPQTLLRRLSLDLIGLPPTQLEIDEFMSHWNSDTESAYQQTVDRLLASPHYGERIGRWWLDQARYADSNGYSVDSPREIWPYRDWVIAALNDDMPFDQFTIEQIAGDLLPDATQAQRIATGFHRNTPLNQEGGIDREQFRMESLFDRVATTGTVWLGLSIGCAQCHDHKFDPITQAEYYRLLAFFNSQDEPSLKVETLRGDSASTLVMKERASPRATHLLVKGDFTRPAETVDPATPACLPDLKLASTDARPSGLPVPLVKPLENDTDGADVEPVSDAPALGPNRLDLARWLVDRQQPLTARVIVNRVWQLHFGRGLVESENDFGMQGTPPSHPELLDWLATEFMEGGWHFKSLHRMIVLSHTYRQSSVVTDRHLELDANNVYLARQNRFRLDAELVRDVALTASGTLDRTVGGPSVFPPLPDGVMRLGQVNHPWKTSAGGDRYRRGLYTFMFRAMPMPTLNVFDAPEGVSSCTQRLRSNTPLQALTLMNDGAFVELARALELVIMAEGVNAAFQRCVSREATSAELAVLEQLDSLTAARAMLCLDETISRE
ncbi:MAG: DUF1553 domain-containing protein [Pirellulaceae bacterium]|nr:DUF1553 domain-containing protein [Pirellulaceae bacterium]